MKLKKITIFMIIVCILGLSLLLYPSFSNYWNTSRSTRALNDYVDKLHSLDEETYRSILTAVQAYNEELLAREDPYSLPEEMRERYFAYLDITGTGVMGYIDIPSIHVSLPIYHGTDEKVLQHAVGHLDWSSLPIGGVGTHCVLSGHRGLPTARLFTNLDNVREGDIFTLTVLEDTIRYEVDQIRTVLPDELSDLKIESDRDYCTLVTCTPYSINSHRLLIRGHRVGGSVEDAMVVSEAVKVDQLLVALYLAIPVLLALFLMVMLKKPESAQKTKEN